MMHPAPTMIGLAVLQLQVELEAEAWIEFSDLVA